MFITRKRNLLPIVMHSLFSPTVDNLLSVSLNLAILAISYNQEVVVWDRLLLLNIMFPSCNSSGDENIWGSVLFQEGRVTSWIVTLDICVSLCSVTVIHLHLLVAIFFPHIAFILVFSPCFLVYLNGQFHSFLSNKFKLGYAYVLRIVSSLILLLFYMTFSFLLVYKLYTYLFSY